jgi:SecD/SecF fusion protein
MLNALLFVMFSALILSCQYPACAATTLQHVVLIYEVDPGSLVKGENVDIQDLANAVTRRVNPAGTKEIVVRPRASDQIEIIIPEIEKKELDHLKRVIASPGLEFRILANRRDNKDVVERALAEPSKMEVRDRKGKRLAWWLPIKAGQEAAIKTYQEAVLRTRNNADRKTTEVLVVNDANSITGAYLKVANVAVDNQGKPCINFQFNNTGGKLLAELTEKHLPDKVTDRTHKLAIILDGEVYSAPAIQSVIRERGQITGSFTHEEVQELVSILNAGSLPARIRPVKK